MYRLVERWGARLRGRTFLIDIDNTATVGAARARFSKSEDMQELVRRLVELAAKHNLWLRPVHTPGAMLHRPDQTSRGAAVEEPRVRLRREVFQSLELVHGPFTEMIGPERAFARRPGSDSPKAIWAHPTYDTVGSALGRIGERLDPHSREITRGLVLVPWAPQAAWWPLVRHFTCVARFGVGSRHLEENRAGRWTNVSARRPSVILAFPVHSGTVVPLDAVVVAVPADAAQFRVLRVATAVVAGDLLDVESVEDAQIGIEEAASLLLDSEPDGRIDAVLWCDADRLRIRVSAACRPVDDEFDGFRRTILDAVTDDVQITHEPSSGISTVEFDKST